MGAVLSQALIGDYATQLVTWNPADKGADIVLSGGNLSVTGSGGVTNAVRATLARSTGKFFFEFTLTNPGSSSGAAVIGFANAAASIAAQIGTSDASAGLVSEGAVAFGATGSASFTIANAISQTWVAGDVVQVAIDLTAGKIWFGRNGTYLTGSPSAGTLPAVTFASGLVLFPAFASSSTTLGTGTANFGATPFSSIPPAGFRPWNVL
jgi:SPRY domain